MIDASLVIQRYLASQTLLTDLVDDRIWKQRYYPIKGYLPSQGGAVVFRSRGGGGIDYSGALYMPSWMFKCYGETEVEADAVYRALVDVFHDAATGGMKRAALEGTGQMSEEPRTGWIYVACIFETILERSFEIPD